eukprot:2366256-Rhodomonas_salina.2
MSPHHCSAAVGAASAPPVAAVGEGEAPRDPSEVRSMTCRASSSPDAPALAPAPPAPSCSPSDSDSDEEVSSVAPNKLRTIGVLEICIHFGHFMPSHDTYPTTSVGSRKQKPMYCLSSLRTSGWFRSAVPSGLR